ncbi:Pre-mRNA-splicing factor SF2 [Tetrabaena socialis]|uniref:Pre-mRNA-splicing factor SF2 n=1 Tax=Tetrabaena socialis TaxID=47790 RepID=A0A2J7ZNZ6_9CHLO|nr:Pre-mRNA-splicing factor SF2 [Tetrabaena socialis]|eukprot:PNH01982.1 Pre-mRNA-splicing factor SF2 [Tetrabaena socialis]
MAQRDRYGGRAIFVGNLPIDVREKELDEIFYKFGRIRMIDIKKPARPPGFAFIEFDDPRGAEEAARRRNNYEFAGLRMRVEIARGGEGQGAQQPLRMGYRPIRNTLGFRLYVKGLPRSASWQDLKDFIRRVCKPLYTEVFKDHRDEVIGVVEFESKDDMKATVRKLDDTEFANPFDKGHYVRLVEDLEERGGRSRSRSPRRDRERDRGREKSRSRSRSRSLSRNAKHESPSRSRSRSPSKAKAKSKSRSRSRSRSLSRSRSRSPAADAVKEVDRKSVSPRRDTD